MTTIVQAFRSVMRAPVLGLAAIVCIGVGAAATTAIVTLVTAVLLRPVPFPNPDRLVRIWFDEPDTNPRISLSIPETDDFRRMKSFDAFAATARVRTTARFGNNAERVRGEGVSSGYFDMLGLQPHRGRLFLASDHGAAAPPVVVLSYGTWIRHYGEDPAAIGREFRTEGAVYTVIGIAPPGFQGTVEDDVVEFFIPIEHYEPLALRTARNARPAWVIGRVGTNESLGSARSEAEAILATLKASYPDVYRRWRVRVEPFGESWRERLRSGGSILLGAALLLLMIAAVNVGCLLLTRVLDRQREFAIRAALGANTGRLVAQLFVEALLLVSAGGAVGALASPWVLRGFLELAPLDRLSLPTYLRLETDVTSIAVSVAVLACAGLLAGTVPAMLGRRVTPSDMLRDGARGVLGSRSERRWSAWLIASETALTLMLLVAGGLLIRSYSRLANVDLGLERSRIARLAVTLHPTDYGSRDRLPVIYERLRAELAAVAGVERVGFVYPTLPPWDGYRTRVRIPGVELPRAPDGLESGAHLIDSHLLQTLDIAIVAGRGIETADRIRDAHVAVISQSLAAFLGGAENAVGRSISLTSRDQALSNGLFQVIGVVENVAYDGVVEQDTRRFIEGSRGSRHDVYVPLAQFPTTVVSIGVSTSSEPGVLMDALRQKITSVAPFSPLHWVSTMEEEVALEYQPTRFYAVLVTVFSSSALALTSVGLFALLAHSAARRTRELSLRLALGASRLSTVQLVLRGGLGPVGIGLIIGAAGALTLSRTMSSVLYGVSGFDAPSLAVSATAIVIVALGAGVIPASRVGSLDPARILRGE